MYKKINYGSESVDFTQAMANNFKANKYYLKTKEEQIRLLETSIIKYSISKLAKWDIDMDFDQIQDVEKALYALYFNIPSKKEEMDGFFNQYILGTIYILGVINKQRKDIMWVVSDNNSQITFSENNLSEITTITTGSNIEKYKLTLEIINAYKEKYISIKENKEENSDNGSKPFVKSYGTKPTVRSYGYNYTKSYPRKK